MVVFLDNHGRSYSTMAHGLPSARGQGEPITGRFSPPSMTRFSQVLMGKDSHYLLSSDFAYGFIVKHTSLIAKAKGGKSVLSVSENSKPCDAIQITDINHDKIAMVTSAGYLWIIAAKDIPHRLRGKGVKLLNIPVARLKSSEEKIVSMILIPRNSTLLIHAGKRYKNLKGKELLSFSGKLGQRGKLLPQGYRNVTLLEVKL
jgi:topoisomerase-4 subunit A